MKRELPNFLFRDTTLDVTRAKETATAVFAKHVLCETSMMFLTRRTAT